MSWKDKVFTGEELIVYLQSQMDDYKAEEKQFGTADRVVQSKLEAMIACKEMVEAFLKEPVNLKKDGKVTVGF